MWYRKGGDKYAHGHSKACDNIWIQILRQKFIEGNNTSRESVPHFSGLVVNIFHEQIRVVLE